MRKCFKFVWRQHVEILKEVNVTIRSCCMFDCCCCLGRLGAAAANRGPLGGC
ncbi:hypothetical protein F511_46996 [Dorcoceras hygrometricum]|uniref:Uncharacterized protein n=1 Tax=Dorcoceras hygrometricum TaxID=472368 RepID=A0A2Z6ZZF8_9LAMI|nr:hypothetical protein F511_46996 [Dorcoceras hygrometricum]